MGRRANLPDRAKVHNFKECISKAEAEALRKKYGFRCTRVEFHRVLNQALSWHDTFLDCEQRPAKESIKILRAIHTGATSLRACFAKPGADKLLCIHHEEPVADPFMAVHHPTADMDDVLVTLEARCKVWPAPAKRLRQDIENASERLRDALSRIGVGYPNPGLLKAECEKPTTLFSYGRFPNPADLPSTLDWLIQASANAAKEIEHRTRQRQPDEMPRGRKKPTRNDHRRLLMTLWELALSPKLGQDDKTPWPRTNKQCARAFYEFAREIFPKAGIRLSDRHIARLVEEVGADK